MDSPEFSAASEVRKIVFIDEQEFSYDLDDTDKTAFHVLICDDDKPIAAGRFFFDENNQPHIGRVAVLKEYRRSGVGRYLMEILEKTASEQGADYVTLGAQMRAAEFYSRVGYVPYGEPYFEEYCEHINMKKSL
ncbi:MAG: GNAT family N-acetyltransferase [Ruminococcus sp.]|jgi:predicted GNAT family N-acyltransferase|nr:GNAT family N-acetyltransferase [Ruminococcus sp.]